MISETDSPEPTTEMQFGDLILAFTDRFAFRWNDGGSGARKDVSFWHPVAPDGFHVLGDVAVPFHDKSLEGDVAAICVKPAPDAQGAPLAAPTDYTLIWKDSGSGARMDGSCWRPKPPDGYRALGDVFVKGYNKPETAEIMCVRENLVHIARIGGTIWEDHGSGARTDFGAYEVIAPDQYMDAAKGLFAPHTFAGSARHSPPHGAPVVYCLNLPVPFEEGPQPETPKLDSTNPPPSATGATLDRVVYVPFTAIQDSEQSLHWKVVNSPFYAIERIVNYKVEMWDYNQTKVEQCIQESITTGIVKSVSETFSVKTGISVTAEGGVGFLGTGGKVSATISVELGWQRTTGLSEFEERTLVKSIVVPPNKAVAMWATSYTLRARRGDSSYLPAVLVFQTDFFVHAEYPDGETIIEHPPRREILYNM